MARSSDYSGHLTLLLGPEGLILLSAGGRSGIKSGSDAPRRI